VQLLSVPLLSVPLLSVPLLSVSLLSVPLLTAHIEEMLLSRTQVLWSLRLALQMHSYRLQVVSANSRSCIDQNDGRIKKVVFACDFRGNLAKSCLFSPSCCLRQNILFVIIN